jgi:DNA primase large subunit
MSMLDKAGFAFEHSQSSSTINTMTSSNVTNVNSMNKDEDCFTLEFKDDIKEIKYEKVKENDYFIEVTQEELTSRLMEETDQDMKEFCKLFFN